MDSDMIPEHAEADMAKHPLPFFVQQDERDALEAGEYFPLSLMRPRVRADRDAVFAAIREVETLAVWVNDQLDG